MGRRESPFTPLRPGQASRCVNRIQKWAFCGRCRSGLLLLLGGATRLPHPRPGAVQAHMFWRKQVPRAGDPDTTIGRDSRNNAYSSGFLVSKGGALGEGFQEKQGH